MKKPAVKRFLIYAGTVLFYIVFSPTILYMKSIVANNNRIRKETRNKVRHFKPTIHDGFWGKRVSWEMRDRPLTDQELKDFD